MLVWGNKIILNELVHDLVPNNGFKYGTLHTTEVSLMGR